MSATVADWRDRARQLHAADPERSCASIGRELGVSRHQAWKAVHPAEARAMEQRSNAARRAAKRAWEREHDHGICEECGAPTMMGAERHGTRVCRACSDRGRREVRMARARVIERMWAEGASLRVIAAEVGWSTDHLGVEMVALRREGLADLPYRRRPRAA